MSPDQVAQFKDLLSKPRQIPALIVVHQDPDTDALGSALALKLGLAQVGVPSVIWNRDDFEPSVQFLVENQGFSRDFDEDFYDLIIYVDCSNQARVKEGQLLEPFLEKATVVNLDHHADNPQFGDINLFEIISSVGELLYSLFNQLNWAITPQIATYLYAAMCFDTGRFLYSNTTSATLRVAADLIEKGADVQHVHYHLFENRSSDSFTLMKMALDRLVVTPRFAYTILPKSAPKGEIKVIDFIRQLGSVDVFMVFTEAENNQVKINLRSRSEVNVRVFANRLGGGGHDKAAGITLLGGLESVVSDVTTAFEAYLDGDG